MNDTSLLRLGIPKGSLEEPTIELFRKAGWRIKTTSRSYFPTIDDPEVSCALVRPQEMPRYVAGGTLDAGVTGKDWIEENSVDVHVVSDFIYSKASLRPTRWVLAVPGDSPIQKIEDLAGKRVASEMTNFTKRYFAERGIEVEVEFSWGATEAKAADGLVDAIVEVTETGSTIKAHGLRIVADLLESNPQLIVSHESWANPWKREKIEQISLLLRGGMSAETLVGIKLNVPKERLDQIIAMLPSITAPTVASLYPAAALRGEEWFSIESVIEEEMARDLIPKLINQGAVGIVEYPLNKVV